MLNINVECKSWFLAGLERHNIVLYWVIPKKIHPPPPPDGWHDFLTPPSVPGFPKPLDPPLIWISKVKDPPSCSDFHKFLEAIILIYSQCRGLLSAFRYCKNSSISHSFLLKFLAQNRGCSLSTRTFSFWQGNWQDAVVWIHIIC